MRLALRELRRSRRRFVPTTAALALLVVLLLMLGGLLDGLYIGSTGALRAQPGISKAKSTGCAASMPRRRRRTATPAAAVANHNRGWRC